MRESADVHGDIFPKRFAEDLVFASDSRGKLEERIFEVARQLEKKFSKYPWFIGVAPFGSRVKGYSLPNEGSDIDVAVLYDSSISGMSSGACWAFVQEECKSAEKDFDKNLVAVPYDLKLPKLETFLQRPLGKGIEAILFTGGLMHLCTTGFGPKVDEYARAIGDAINKLPIRNRTMVVNRITGDILIDENKARVTEGKIRDRIRGMEKVSDEEFKGLVESRKSHWRKHVVEVLGIQE